MREVVPLVAAAIQQLAGMRPDQRGSITLLRVRRAGPPRRIPTRRVRGSSECEDKAIARSGERSSNERRAVALPTQACSGCSASARYETPAWYPGASLERDSGDSVDEIDLEISYRISYPRLTFRRRHVPATGVKRYGEAMPVQLVRCLDQDDPGQSSAHADGSSAITAV
ncbi:hypothetical protein HN011_007098 [Eciton burchellii]|nr:hypothetical protein HN011_007098 [Eciton burchellii]